uniref:terminase large subunit n=1 Tax=uncultured Flavonifractor sp. TaxID=1193534 RepID=UPI002628707D|nr:terminase TerL endonuclease subunit [uncultured Flavonifractor sp.]
MPELLQLGPVAVCAPDDGAVLRYSEQAVQDVLDFFSLLCFASNEWAGEPFQLLPWELDAIQRFYGVQEQDEDGGWSRYRRFLYDELPKKNGKTEFAAGLGLYHLLWDGEKRPKVGIFSSDKENAAQVYDAAKYMVEHTCLGQPEHDPIAWAVESKREIHTRYGGVLKVYSADAETKHGYSFSAIIFDELHAQPNRKLWDVLTAGSDAARRQQAVIVLTTAGDDPDRKSIGWEIHEKCRRLLAWRRGEPERELDADDPAWCPIMYGVSVLTGDDPDRIAALDIYDEAVWYACNPGLGHNLKLRDFRREARAAKQSEAAERLFRWLRLNQWIATKTVGWLPLTLYDKTQWNREEWQGLKVMDRRQAVRDCLMGKKCFGGLDLSTTTDLTALTLLFPPQEGLEHLVALFWAWRPEEGVVEAEQRDHVPYRDWARAEFLTLCPGDMVDFSMVEETVAWCANVFDLDTLGVDPYLSRTITQRLMAAGVNVVEIPQTIKELSPAMKELERLLRAHALLHEHNTAARWCFGNVRCYVDGNENLKPMKNRSTGRIDMTVAWIIAMATAMVRLPQGPDINKHVLSEDWGI